MSLINSFTVTTLQSLSYAVISTTVDVVSVLLLIGLLTWREMINVAGGSRRPIGKRGLDIAIVPLLAVFGMIVANRLLDLMR
jgi:hypothetical protein